MLGDMEGKSASHSASDSASISLKVNPMVIELRWTVKLDRRSVFEVLGFHLS